MPGIEDREFAATEGLEGAALTRVADNFRDYWLAKSGRDAVKSDWHATWRNWVRRENEARSGTHARAGPNLGRPTTGVASAAAGLNALFGNRSN
jgi:hypothetical protein